MKRALLLVAAMVGLTWKTAEAADLQKFTISTMRITANAPVLIAKERGYFRDEGLDAQLTLFDSAQDIVLAVASGATMVGNGGFTVGFYNLASKGGLRVIGGYNREEKGYRNNGFLVTNQAYDTGLKTLKDLPGHRVGINATGSTQHYALGLISEKYGFDMSRVSVVPMQNYPNLTAAFKGGQIDVMIATVNIANQLMGQKLGHVIGWSGDETPWQLGAIYTRPAVIEEGIGQLVDEGASAIDESGLGRFDERVPEGVEGALPDLAAGHEPQSGGDHCQKQADGDRPAGECADVRGRRVGDGGGLGSRVCRGRVCGRVGEGNGEQIGGGQRLICE